MIARDARAVLASLQAHLPTGWAWTRDPDAALTQLLAVPAGEIARLEADYRRLIAEAADPRVATDLIADFERLLGPDPCGRDQLALTTDQRRRIVHQRLTMRGGASVAYYVRLAAILGVTITIEELVPTVCGQAVCGDALTPEREIFAWIVRLPATVVVEAQCGVSECGDTLGAFLPSLVECVIRQQAQSHTLPVFAYAEPA